MRFLHLIRPVMCVLPEVASPDRKVRTNFTFHFASIKKSYDNKHFASCDQQKWPFYFPHTRTRFFSHSIIVSIALFFLNIISFRRCFTYTINKWIFVLLLFRSPSVKNYCGQPLHCLFFWYVVKYPFTVSNPRNRVIHSIGCVSFWHRIVVRLWN